MAQSSAIKYRAFLSYSHADSQWAMWLHRALERFRIDEDFVGRETSRGAVPKSLSPIFRDREEFSGGHSLTEATITALDASAALIVICSPNAASRPAVNEEVRQFRSRHPERPVIPVIVAGSWPENAPPALRYELGVDGVVTDVPITILGPDLRGVADGKGLGLAKVIAGLIGIGVDEVFQRAERAQRFRTRVRSAVIASLCALSIAASGSAIYAWKQLGTNEAFLDATLTRTTEIINEAVTQAEIYNVPRMATLKFLSTAEKLFDDMARLGRPTFDLRYRKSLMLIEFARNYSILGNISSARVRSTAAIDLLSSLAKERPESVAVQYAMADALLQVGHALYSQGHIDAALPQFQLSLFIAQRFSPTDQARQSKWQAIKTIANENIGDLLIWQGKPTEAIKHFAGSYNDKNPTSIERIGTAYLTSGNKEAALKEYYQQHSINELMSKQYPSDLNWQRNLSVSHDKIGKVLVSQGSLNEALSHFRAALAIRSRLVATDISRKPWQRDLAASYGYVGDVLIAQDNTAGAVEAFQKKAAILEALLIDSPGDAFVQQALAGAHGAIADFYVAEGNLDQALVEYKKSHTMLERVVSIDPTNAQIQLDLLWSHSLLALFGDDSFRRFEAIVAALKGFQEKNALTSTQARWLPVAEEGLVAVRPGNEHWQWQLLQIFWRTASFTDNPIRQAKLVLAMVRKLNQERKLTAEQAKWIPVAEEQLLVMQGNRSTGQQLGFSSHL